SHTDSSRVSSDGRAARRSETFRSVAAGSSAPSNTAKSSRDSAATLRGAVAITAHRSSAAPTPPQRTGARPGGARKLA
ncbi:hypothetical protein, partial [Nocardia abscessus]|uniref:hypothetical protein n=1 Tax=Nocardia abscessus TaxID=120957 RepID=UPI002458141A